MKPTKPAAEKPANSKEIARLAGVSQATVSRVLSGHPHVAAETRQRVLDVIEQTGYLPNVLARELVTQRTGTLGLVVSNITNQFYPELIEAVCALAAKHGLSIILGNTQQDPERQRDYLRLLIERRVEGIILTSTMLDAPYVAELIRKRYPLVLVNRVIAENGGDSVTIDNAAGARAAVAHFHALGHRRIGFVGGLSGTSTNRDREVGFLAALASFELDPTDAILPGDYTAKGAQLAARRYASLPNRPTAILCADDGTALGFIDGLADAGIAVPDDCAVMGFDDVREAAHRTIGLTSIRQPVARMAELAMELLMARIGGDRQSEPSHIVLPAEIVVRRTCGADPAWPAAAAGREEMVAAPFDQGDESHVSIERMENRMPQGVQDVPSGRAARLRLAEMPPLIITCAITGDHSRANNPNLPQTADEQAQAAADVAAAGASIVHIHGRSKEDPAKGSNQPEVYRDINAAMRAKAPEIIIDNTQTVAELPTDGVDLAGNVYYYKSAPMYANPEIMSLNPGPMTFRGGANGPASAYVTTFDETARTAEELRKRSIKPQVFIYHPGHLDLLDYLIQQGALDAPYFVQLVFGQQSGIPCTAESVLYMTRNLPADTIYQTCALGLDAIEVNLLSILLGGHVRTGMEDNLNYRDGELTTGNVQLVERIVRTATDAGRRVATASEARRMLGIGAPTSY